MAETRTIVLPGTGSSTASYALAPGVLQNIESVVATVDTSGSGDVTPVLTIAEQTGNVVADKQQQNAIAGGGSGRATWALGLADETAVSGYIRYHVQNVGDRLLIETNGGSGAQPVEVDYVLDKGQFHITAMDPTRGEFLVQSRFVHLFTTSGDFRIEDGGDITASGGYLTLSFAGGELDLTDSFFFNLNVAGKNVTVNDHNGSPIFRIDENGDLHGKAGKTLTFDL